MSIGDICDLASTDPEIPTWFLRWLLDNEHVWLAFEREAMLIIAAGWKHYSSRTLVCVLRHHSRVHHIAEDRFKLNNNHSPYLSRLFVLLHPQHQDFWSFRSVGGGNVSDDEI